MILLFYAFQPFVSYHTYMVYFSPKVGLISTGSSNWEQIQINGNNFLYMGLDFETVQVMFNSRFNLNK